jgi:hypothetical protein
MAKQKRTSKNKQQLSSANAHGCIYHLNLPRKLMKRTATKCPILHSGGKSGDRRGIRHIVLNDTFQLTSVSLLNDLKIEIQKQLSQMENGGITVSTKMSNIEWVLSAPNTRNNRCGQKHRDTFYRVPGYLTVLIFFGQRQEKGYGSAKIWRNSSDFMEEVIYIPNDGEKFHHHDRQLQKLDGGQGLKVNVKDYNCVIFDSRLIHQSLPHSLPGAHRVSLTFYLTLPNLLPPHQTDSEGYVHLSDCDITDLSNDVY